MVATMLANNTHISVRHIWRCVNLLICISQRFTFHVFRALLAVHCSSQQKFYKAMDTALKTFIHGVLIFSTPSVLSQIEWRWWYPFRPLRESLSSSGFLWIKIFSLLNYLVPWVQETFVAFSLCWVCDQISFSSLQPHIAEKERSQWQTISLPPALTKFTIN